MAHEHALLSLEQAKAYLEVDHDDFDELIDGLIAEAEGACAGVIGRSLAVATYTEVFDGGIDALQLRHYPVRQVTSVTDGLGTVGVADDLTMDVETYRVDARLGLVWRTNSVGNPQCWEVGAQRFTVVYDAGLEASAEWIRISQELRGTIRDVVVDLFENRNPAEAQRREGSISKTLRPGVLPDRVLRVWKRYREVL